MRVSEVLLPRDRIAVVATAALFKEALEAMTAKRLGIACVVDAQDNLVGIITDGDIRRMLLKDQKPFSALFADDAVVHSVRRPSTVHPDSSLEDAVTLMEDKQVWDLPVVDEDGKLVGLLHLHPAIKALLQQ